MIFSMAVRIDDEAKPATPIAANSLFSATDIPSRLGATYAIANAVRFTRDNSHFNGTSGGLVADEDCHVALNSMKPGTLNLTA